VCGQKAARALAPDGGQKRSEAAECVHQEGDDEWICLHELFDPIVRSSRAENILNVCQMSGMEEQMEAAFSLRGTSYRLQISICQVTTFSISLYDDDQLERWIGEFSAPFIEDLTRKAGSARSANVFWKMLQFAIAGTSSDITFDILSGQDVARMKSDSGGSLRINPNCENMYLIVCYVTSFDQVRYPLLLHKKSYMPDEWRAIVRALKNDNRKLQNQVGASNQSELVHSLETQVYDLNAKMRDMLDEKDRTIADLKKKITTLEKAQVRASKETAATKARQPITKRKANQLRRPSAGGQSASSSAGSRRSSTRSSSRGSSGSFKRFNPTEWIRNRQSSASSGGSSWGSSSGPSPTVRPRKKVNQVRPRPETNLNRIRALVNQRYKY
jgi:coiled-coil domain-containing protein 61